MLLLILRIALLRSQLRLWTTLRYCLSMIMGAMIVWSVHEGLCGRGWGGRLIAAPTVWIGHSHCFSDAFALNVVWVTRSLAAGALPCLRSLQVGMFAGKPQTSPASKRRVEYWGWDGQTEHLHLCRGGYQPPVFIVRCFFGRQVAAPTFRIGL